MKVAFNYSYFLSGTLWSGVFMRRQPTRRGNQCEMTRRGGVDIGHGRATSTEPVGRSSGCVVNSAFILVESRMLMQNSRRRSSQVARNHAGPSPRASCLANGSEAVQPGAGSRGLWGRMAKDSASHPARFCHEVPRVSSAISSHVARSPDPIMPSDAGCC